MIGNSPIRLYQFIAFAEVFDAELGVGGATIVVFYDGVADIDRVAGLDVVEEVGHVEGDGGDVVIRMRLLDEFEFEVAAFCTYLAAHAVVIHIFRQEYRSAVARAERLELLEDAEELRCDLGEVQAGVNVNDRYLHLWDDSA